MPRDHSTRKATPEELEAEVAELRAENAELRTEIAELHELIALNDHMRRIQSDYAHKGWSRLAVVDREKQRVERLAKEFAEGLDHYVQTRDATAVVKAALALLRYQPWPTCDTRKWFAAAQKVARETKGPGPEPKVPLGVVARFLAEGLRGRALVHRICNEMGPDVDERAVWSAIKRYKKFTEKGLSFLLELTEDGRILVTSMGTY
jgi:hypothetical protein